MLKNYSYIIIFIIAISISITLLYSNFNIEKIQTFDISHIDTLSKVSAEEGIQGDETQILARCVNGEARGETYVGQVAVAAVILNRVKHSSFPNTLAGVIYQPGAFTAVDDGQINAAIEEDSEVYKACSDAMNGWDPTGGAIYYYNPAKTTNQWIYSREVITTIGKHKFAR